MINNNMTRIRNKLGMLKKEHLYKDSSFFFINTILTTGLSALFWWLLLRIYPPDMVGKNIVILSFSQLLTTGALFGLGYSIIHFIPSGKGEKKEIINFSFSFVISFSFVLSILFGLFSTLLPSNVKIDLDFLLYFVLLVSFLSAYQLIYQVMAALRSGLIIVLLGLFTGICRLILVFLLRNSDFIYSPLLAFICPVIVLDIFVIFLLLPRKIPGYNPKFNIKINKFSYLLKYSGPNFVGNLLHDIPFQLLPILIADFISLSYTTYFFVAWQIYGLISTISGSISLSLFVEGSNNKEEILILGKRAFILAISFTTMVVLFIILLGKSILMLFGKNFADYGTSILHILSLAAIPASIVYLLTTIERVRHNLIQIIITFGIIASISLLIPIILKPTSIIVFGWVWVIAQLIAATYLIVFQSKKYYVRT
jgi:O-antigen/teichoic acid export membrane protein